LLSVADATRAVAHLHRFGFPVPSLHFPVMPHPIAGLPDKLAILAKMSEMRTAGNVPVHIDEFVRMAADAVVEDRKRFMPNRATLYARMATIRAQGRVGVEL
jgi:hypothetical protein